MSLLSPLAELLFPKVCPACKGLMGEGTTVVCTQCRLDIPLTEYCGMLDNPVAAKFWGHLPVVHASSFMFFTGSSRYRHLVHTFKYYGGWKLALQMGEWYGSHMEQSGFYSDVDVVVPVPLHLFRRIRRGYNQSEYIAQGIAKALGKPVDLHSVKRRVNNPSQTNTLIGERWDNVKDIFSIRNPSLLDGKHILLVDDVLTTGATLISCAETIKAASPGSKISIATLAVSKKSLNIQ